MISPMDADLQLLRIGDRFTIERMVKDYRTYDSNTSWDYVQTKFERSKQPRIIPYLAEDFYSKEDPRKGNMIKSSPGSMGFSVLVPPRSIFSAVTVTRIIEKSPVFSKQMKEWAIQAYGLRLKSPSRFQKLMQGWWETNKAAFASADYQNVVSVTEEEVASKEAVAPVQTAIKSKVNAPSSAGSGENRKPKLETK